MIPSLWLFVSDYCTGCTLTVRRLQHMRLSLIIAGSLCDAFRHLLLHVHRAPLLLTPALHALVATLYV